MPEEAVQLSPVDRALKRRSVVRKALIVIVVLLFCSIVIGNLWQQARGGDDWARLDQQFFVVQSVMSGDRMAVESADGRTQEIVQLLGVDAPDLQPAGEPSPPGALEAYQSLRDIAQSKRVMLRLPALSPRQADGLVRAYVYLDGDPPSLSVNERLVADGNAYADRRRDHPFQKQFDQAEGEARRKKRGFWASVRDDQQPAWRQEWLRKLKDERSAENAPVSHPRR